ncbi:hypothetical protein [Cohaesibacter intestini]|uniref:hypothetical protein n=1 Tax=Cohaesibacter intestini TaxID=2211145 RepID=UPI000DEABC35|nr:hypothetical protein [Cohaesibacter intestini]
MFEHVEIFFFSAHEMFLDIFMLENWALAFWLFEAVGLLGLLVVAGYMSPRLLLFITMLLAAIFVASIMMLGGFDKSAFRTIHWSELNFIISNGAVTIFPIVFFSVFLFAYGRVKRGTVAEASPLGSFTLSSLLLFYLLLFPMTYFFCFSFGGRGISYDTASKFVAWTSGALLCAGAVFALALSVLGYLTHSVPVFFASEKVARTSLLVLCAAPWLFFDFKDYIWKFNRMLDLIVLEMVRSALAGG